MDIGTERYLFSVPSVPCLYHMFRVGLIMLASSPWQRSLRRLAPPNGAFSAYSDQLLSNANPFDYNVAQLQEVIRVKRRYEVLKYEHGHRTDKRMP